ncbi:hypothetical protein [Pontibacter anaerobius]|uniref:Lipoprotein n=1 Tax=Pontibacter anaerobius TaxID=2993940 RepID=A0ABT3RCJ7_9BACT|nr:hypothetical protein [Pontibacter anaerobius]MCX2739246.1 hypothetical protein [Pontibacter anaerobius]
MLHRIFLLFVVLAIVSCEKDTDISVKSEAIEAKKGRTTDSYTTYVIRKGQHSSDNSPYKSLSTNSLKFEAIFDQSAVYQTENANNQADINKLYGMADCSSLHQSNSARFGWRWYNNKLEILGYVYNNGTRHYKLIGAVELNQPQRFELLLDGNTYIFRVNGLSEVVLPRGCSGTGRGYRLYPYFGGDEVAPHDITIKIKNL